MSAALRRVKAWLSCAPESGDVDGVLLGESTIADLRAVLALAERAEAAESALVIIRDGRHPVGQARDVAHAALAPKPNRGRRVPK